MIPSSIPAIVGALLLTLAVPRAAAQAPGALAFAYATTVYALDDTTSLVELSYQYSDRGLVYARDNGREVGRLRVSFTVWDSIGRIVLDNSWITASARPQQDDTLDHALLGVKLFGIRPGTHRARIAFMDVADESRHDSADFDLLVRGFPPGTIGLSDVQVISEISPSDDNSNRFFKNGYIIYPNVLSSIEPPFLLLNSYMEIYNANTVPTSQFDVIYGLADSNGTLIFQKEEKRDRPTASAIVDVHSLVLEELPSGSYFLLVKAYAGLRGTATDSAMIVRPFTLVNPEKDERLASGTSASSNGATVETDPLYAGLNEVELDHEFEMVHYLSIEREREIWKELDGAPAKARFLTEFWARRDPSPGSPDNELREDYAKRIESANAMYREPLIEHGYQSNRGRVLLQYGKPDQIDRHYFDKNRKPYEIWVYSKDNYRFVFVDRSGMGKFILVHSDVPGEIRQDNWERLYATIHENFDR